MLPPAREAHTQEPSPFRGRQRVWDVQGVQVDVEAVGGRRRRLLTPFDRRTPLATRPPLDPRAVPSCPTARICIPPERKTRGVDPLVWVGREV